MPQRLLSAHRFNSYKTIRLGGKAALNVGIGAFVDKSGSNIDEVAKRSFLSL